MYVIADRNCHRLTTRRSVVRGKTERRYSASTVVRVFSNALHGELATIAGVDDSHVVICSECSCDISQLRRERRKRRTVAVLPCAVVQQHRQHQQRTKMLSSVSAK
ncbi:hypothetical protein PUN28_012922 [Cardiocondyla obscurior]|uniref:Uncharacterized protein n=1 Tax=Cardiocondyla obscurior TaxID=286306 RepID=A0AAW2F9Z1_9HYME